MFSTLVYIGEPVSLENWLARITVFKVLIILTLGITVGLIVKHYYDRRRIFKFGAKLPGPKPWPIIGNAWHFLDADSDILFKLKKVQGNRKLLALWFGHNLHVFLSSPEYAEIFCKSSKLLDRSSKTKLFEPVARKGVMITNGADWRKARKLMETGLPYTTFKNSISVIETQGDILIHRLRKEVGKPIFPIMPYLKDLLFDIISEFTILDFGQAQKGEFCISNEMDEVIQYIHNRMYNPLYHIEYLYKLLPEGKKFYSLLDGIKKHSDEMILYRIKEYEEEKKNQESYANPQNAKKRLFLETLMNDGTLSLSDMRDHLYTMVFGAYDTTANSIAAVLMMLALHPDIQERVYQELISINQEDSFDEKVQQLKYLDLVIKEVLRLFPSVPTTFRRATEDVQMGKYIIPAGADVSLNIFELHRDPEQYENPHAFNPDNFLPENVAKRHPFAFVPFANGQRKCLGAKLSMLIMKIILPKFLLNYSVECDYKKMEDITFRGDFTFRFRDKGLIRIFERQ